MPRKKVKRKHIPHRTCIGCREVLPKRSLIRVVRASDAVRIDPSGKLAGRGAYLHDRKSCWEKALKGSLSVALKVELTSEDKEHLADFLQNLPEDEPGG